MKREIILIRHGMTEGNLKRQYIGATDQPLCPEGAAQLKPPMGEAPSRVYVSGLIRCGQTAGILFPEAQQIVVPGLEEMNFGIFEGKSYEELKDTPDYQNWLDSGGEAPIPGGECKADFCDRCCEAFLRLMEQTAEERMVFVLHGGTVMALLWRLGLPRREYYDWQIKNGESLSLYWDGESLIRQDNV